MLQVNCSSPRHFSEFTISCISIALPWSSEELGHDVCPSQAPARAALALALTEQGDRAGTGWGVAARDVLQELHRREIAEKISR